MKLLALSCLCSILTACATVQTYNSHVSAREDSLNGYAKGSNYGVGWTHRVEYGR